MRNLPLYALCSLLCGVFPCVANAQATAVVTETVRSKEIADRIEAIGTLRANESVDLTVNVTESITAIHFEDNIRVEEGAVLVEMTSSEEQAQLEEVRSQLREAERQYTRIRTLSKQGNATQSLLDQRKRELDSARARLSATQSRLKDRLVVAPFAGVVGLRNVSIGALVTPGDVVTTLDDDSRMKLDFSVPAVFLDAIKVGQPITATSRAYGERAFEGTISAIGSRIDPATRAFPARAILPNQEYLLKPGLLMQVSIQANRREVPVIPEEALLPEEHKQFVFRVIDNASNAATVERVEVQIGTRKPGEVEVVTGVSLGDEIVTEGNFKLKEGAEIIRKEVAY